MPGGKRRDFPLTKKSLECLSAKVLIIWNVMCHVTEFKWKRLWWTLSGAGVINRGGRDLRVCARPWRAPKARVPSVGFDHGAIDAGLTDIWTAGTWSPGLTDIWTTVSGSGAPAPSFAGASIGFIAFA
jgi:hypothetical protein